MNILLNGRAHTTAALTIADLIVELALETRMIAIECNLEVIAKSRYRERNIQENDQIEIVHMIGGG
ncbi:MAG: sulfur carrier protein ThiS [Mariprofundaceae bacterium]